MTRLERLRRLVKWLGLMAGLVLLVMCFVWWEWTWVYTSRDGILTYQGTFSAEDSQILPQVHRGDLPQNPGWGITLPLWIPLVLLLLPTAYLFWRERRVPPHYCQSCGYDLTGNTSGVCPECGERTHVECHYIGGANHSL